jgi:hypothetical protein
VSVIRAAGQSPNQQTVSLSIESIQDRWVFARQATPPTLRGVLNPLLLRLIDSKKQTHRIKLE